MPRYFLNLLIILASSSGAYAQTLGLKLLDPERYASIPLAPHLSSGTLPSRVDLSKDFPQPGNQGEQDSCVAWALGYALKSYEENVEFRSQGRSADFHFSPAFIYNQFMRSNPSCKGGMYVVDGLGILETQGILPVSEFPYVENECSMQPSQVQAEQANEWGIARWYRVNVQSEAEIKSHIAAGFPVVISISVDNAFKHFSDEVYTETDGQILGYHALVVVGYDDNLQAFRLFNSWGTKWGDRGMAWVGYPVFKKIAREGYAVFDIVRDRRNPGPKPAPTPTPAPVNCEPWGGPSYRVTGVDPTDVLNMREDPNPSASIVTKIPFDGSGISVRNCAGRWCEVQYACSSGWVNKRFLTSGALTTGLYRVVNVAADDVLYMRPAPRRFSEFVGKIPPSADDVRVTECLSDSSWCRVQYGNKSGWVNYKYLSSRD